MAIVRADTFAENAAILAALKAAVPAGDDWDADIAADARRLTEAAGWSWDFTTWADALADFRGLPCAIEAAASRLLAALMWVENGGAKADSPAMWGEIEAAIAQAKQAGIEPVGRTAEG